MNLLEKIIVSLAVCLFLFSASENYPSVGAATREEAIEAARTSSSSAAEKQQLINLIDSNPDYTSEDFDRIINNIKSQNEQRNDIIGDQLLKNDPIVKIPQTDSSVQSEKNFSSLSPEEKKEYINSLTASEKNQLLKDLDKDKQLEILQGLIDSSSELGMNLTVDEMTDDTVKYSIRDESGKLIESSAVGLIVDDTGINYTALILNSLAVILLSGSGIILLSLRRKHKKQ